MPAAPAAPATTWREVINREHLPLTIGLVFLEFMAGIQTSAACSLPSSTARNYLPLRPNPIRNREAPITEPQLA